MYIGKDVNSETWCFYALKEGIGRFIRYISYPMWSKGSDMPDLYNLSLKVPPNIIEDVILFVEGKVTFYELPRKQGRKQRVIRTIVGDIPLQSGGTGELGKPVQSEQRSSGSGGSDLPDGSARKEPARRLRRSKRLLNENLSGSNGAPVQHVVMTDEQRRAEAIRSTLSRPNWAATERRKKLKEAEAKEASKVLPVAEAKAPEVTVKRKPGRPRRIK